MRLNLNLINGRFITLDDDNHNVESVTIENGQIINFNRPNPNFQTIDVKNNR